jgi:GNAT superfamily N-acetyltransferase
VTKDFCIRLATPADAPVIALHRARMFQDMGELTGPAFELLRARAEASLIKMLQQGEYVGWLASPAGRLDEIAGGAGVQLRQALPHPAHTPEGELSVAQGRHGIVLNVYTEPAWRRQGVAEQLMRQVLAWARSQRLDRLVLHASDDGRRLYERLGFVATNEMRFAARLWP